MRRLNTLICWVLLLTTPPFFVYPHDMPPTGAFHVQNVSDEEERMASDYVLSYDDILQVLDEVESGELEEKCSLEDMERVKHFIAFLAKEGALPDNSEESLSLNEDLEELLNGEETLYKNAISFVDPGDCQYMIVPAVLNGHYDVVLCKGWVSKQWKKVRKFAKKHKKALIIGAAIVVAVAVVVVVVAAASAPAVGTAVASAAGGAAVDTEKKGKNATEPAVLVEAQEAPILKAALDTQVASFKENLVQQQFFEPASQALSLEENGRVLGSAFGHDSLQNVEHQISYRPRLAQEVQEINAKYLFALPGGNNAGHPEVDRKFSTDYTHFFLNSGSAADLTTLSYQVRGESALSYGYYNQAVHDLSRVIEANPNHPTPYLERGMAHFGLGQYEHSLQDYHQFASQTQDTHPFSIPEFSLGFAKGLPRGIYDSGSGLFLLVSDLVTQPLNTGKQMWSALSYLSELACTEQWSALSEAIAPEVHQLITEWSALPSETRGELAGYAFGKYGADIVIPGAAAKVAARGLKGAQELSAIYKGLQTAEKTLVLESVAGLENSAKIAEVMRASQTTIALGEEVGFSMSEMAQLKQAGRLEKTVTSTFERMAADPVAYESIQKFKKAEAFLKPHSGKYMPETKARELIHQAGIKALPRPGGIPENFRVKLSDRPGGIKYVHPNHTHESVRVMPGKSHSPNPSQQNPYVIHMRDGKALDKHGNFVNASAPEAHIPFEEFIYRK